jgi:formylmethanofuran dehydrogenase subunit A
MKDGHAPQVVHDTIDIDPQKVEFSGTPREFIAAMTRIIEAHGDDVDIEFYSDGHGSYQEVACTKQRLETPDEVRTRISHAATLRKIREDHDRRASERQKKLAQYDKLKRELGK